MLNKALPLPSNELLQAHVCIALSRYWPKQALVPSMLPTIDTHPQIIAGPLKLYAISLPDWALQYSVDGKLLIPIEACKGIDNWQLVDWWLAVFLLLECWHERTWELNHGPIHSYSFRLEGWDTRVWDHAWANRIALFLREWAARHQATNANQLFGHLPAAEILMTHDVDAIDKTITIRLKQGAFNLFNAGRHLAHFEIRKALQKLNSAVRFLLGREDWWTFKSLLAQEEQLGIQAHFHFFADTRRKTLMRWLFDPGYDIREVRVQKLMQQIKSQNGVLGLHPTYDAWSSPDIISQQREHLAAISNQSVTTCRQHWLRFSWRNTWGAQENAGIESDSTLMFNDRSGFRASVALAWQPWSQNSQQAHRLTQLPTVLMDSHFYDYQVLSETERRAFICQWIEEVRFVHGQIAVLWHPHTLTEDYGWGEGFQCLINSMKDITTCSSLH
jgi:hypothetical protein